jgi:ribosomal protein S18 acetylase RimI-like enzyme
MSASFDVSLLLYVSDPSTRGEIRDELPFLRREEPLLEAAGSPAAEEIDSIRFSPTLLLDTSDSLLGRVQMRASSPQTARLIVVSDQLVSRRSPKGYQPTVLAGEMRRMFTTPICDHSLGLVALVDDEPRRTTDIDMLANMHDHQSPTLKRAIVRVANSIWLKSPFRHRATTEERFAIKVRWARSLEEIQDCLNLRFRIYNALGYLDESISQSPSQFEVDCCDSHALHLCAVDLRSADVVATLRIVLPTRRRRLSKPHKVLPRLDFDSVETLAQVVEAQAAWIRELADTEEALSRRLKESNPLTPLPIMCNSNFGELWPNFLEQYRHHKTAEISRVVVAPRYRGMGISRLLMRAAIAAAIEMQLDNLLLECIPQHVGMYAKYGFEALPKHHCRSRDLDQLAVGMQLCLQDSAIGSKAVAMANRDRQMLAQGRHEQEHEAVLGRQGLCMCRISECWRQSRYRKWGQCVCPLAQRMDAL